MGGAIGDEFFEVGTHERLAPGENEDGVPIGLRDGVDDEPFDLIGRQFIRGSIGPFSSAMNAAKVACAGSFPKQDPRGWGDMGGEDGEPMGEWMRHGWWYSGLGLRS